MFVKRLPIFLTLILGCDTGIPDSEVAAKVNGEPITKTAFQAEVDRNMARYKGQNHQLPPSIEVRIRESVLRRMIDDKMIEQRAKDLGIEVTKADLDAKFNEYKSRFRTDEAFKDYLTRSKNSEENMRADLRRNMLRDQVVEKLSGNIDVGEADILKYFEENKQRFIEREQVKASRILIRVPPNASDSDKASARGKAQALHKKAASSGADFGAIAKESSNGPQAARGGDLGWFARGRMPPAFDEVAFNLEPGACSEVFEDKMGFHVVKLWEKRPERQRPLAEVQENIKNSLMARKRNEKRREILRELKGKAKIEQLMVFEQPAQKRGPGGPGAIGRPGSPRPGTPRPPGVPGPDRLQIKPPRMPKPTVGKAPDNRPPTPVAPKPDAQPKSLPQ